MNASPALVCERLLFIILTVAIRPPFPYEKLRQRCIQLRIAFGECREVDRLDAAHVSEESQLIEISAYGFLFFEYLVKSVDDDDLLFEAGTGDVVRKIQFCFAYAVPSLLPPGHRNPSRSSLRSVSS